MPKRITLTFPTNFPNDFYARVFWLAEDLYSPIVQAGLGTLNDIDRAQNVIWIDLADNHNLGKVKTIVRKALGHHTLTADALVTIE